MKDVSEVLRQKELEVLFCGSSDSGHLSLGFWLSACLFPGIVCTHNPTQLAEWQPHSSNDVNYAIDRTTRQVFQMGANFVLQKPISTLNDLTPALCADFSSWGSGTTG